MKKTTSKTNRKSTNRISDILDSMNGEGKHLSPIFETEADDVKMPNKKINENSISPQITAEIIREYLRT